MGSVDAWQFARSPEIKSSRRYPLTSDAVLAVALELRSPLGVLRRYLKGPKASPVSCRQRSGECRGGRRIPSVALPACAGSRSSGCIH